MKSSRSPSSTESTSPFSIGRPELRGSGFQRTLRVNEPHDRGDTSNSIEVSYNKRMANRWSAFASYSGTWNRDVDGIVDDPNELIFGRDLDETYQWKVKLNGSVEGPVGISLGAIVEILSPYQGQRTNRFRLPNEGRVTVQMEDAGTQQEDVQPQVNIRASRRFDFGSWGKYFNVSFDVLNLLNANGIKDANYGAGNNFRSVDEIMVPRQYRVGGNISF